MHDDANPQGIQRPRLATKKVYQDDPKTNRPMIPVQRKSRMMPSNIKRSQHPTITIGADGPMDRPRLQVRQPAVGEGNNPQGTPRPNGKSLGEYMGSVVSRGVYNQADEV